MKRCITHLRLVMLICVLSSLHAQQLPVSGPVELHKMFSSSSLVFTGQILSVVPIGTTAGQWNGHSAEFQTFKATIDVDRAYLTEAHTDLSTVIFSRPTGTACTVSHCQDLRTGDYGLFFIKRVKQDNYLL